jgi:hypothetical protein
MEEREGNEKREKREGNEKREKREGERKEKKGKKVRLNYRMTTPPVPCLLVRRMVDAKLFGRTI